MNKHKVIIIAIFIGAIVISLGFSSGKIHQNQLKALNINARRVEERIIKLAQFGKSGQAGVNRVAFSQEDIEGRNYVVSLMKEAGLKVRIDAAGNIIGRQEGTNSLLPPIVFGSHIDSVPNGGKYDGALGVIGAIECIQVLQENRIKTRHPLEVVIFSDEEGGSIGSLALVGELTLDGLEVLSQSGKTVREGISALGGNPDKISEAARQKSELEAFVELHIEQGGILDSKNIAIGVVEGIVGIKRWQVIIKGFSNHAGTTPMAMRQDALLAAAHFILAINRVVTEVPGNQVGTVGQIQCEPGAPNVIPGKVMMSLELRDLSEEKILLLYEKIQKESSAIAEKTKTEISFKAIETASVSALTDSRLRKMIADSAIELGLSHLSLPSGAGHDAQNMARITPTGMIFVPSVGGISHSPQEFTRTEDIANGVNVLLRTILKIDQAALK